MILVILTSVAVIVAFAVANMRLRARTDELLADLQRSAEALDEAQRRADDVVARSASIEEERDAALERVRRARRDAAEVGRRLTAENDARAAVETELAELREELERTRAAGPGGLADLLWALSLRQTEHTWRLSVAIDPATPSPLVDAAQLFRTAVEVEIEAAREESGADVEVVWSEDLDEPRSEHAVAALALVRDLIAVLGTTSTTTTFTIGGDRGGLDVTVVAVSADGTPVEPDLPAAIRTGPTTVRID